MRVRLALLALVITTAPALAQPSRVAATTWVREAPTPASRAIGEIGTGVAVSVLGCAGEWCQVVYGRARGYVQKALLTTGSTQAMPVPGAACFDANHFTPEGPVALTICPAVRP